MRNAEPEKPPLRDETFDKPHDTFFLVRWFSLHTFLLLYRSFKDPLKRSDMFNLGEELYPQRSVSLFRQTEQQLKGTTLQMLLVKGVLWQLLLTGAILTIISGILTLSGPLAVKKILAFMMNPRSTVQDQQSIVRTVIIWIVLYFFKIFLNQLAERQFILASVRTEQTLSLLLHEKIIQLPLTYRLNMKRGSLHALVVNEIRAIASFVLAASSIFSTPACLIVIQILVLVEFKLFGLVVTAAIIIGVTILITLANMMHAKRWKKLTLQGARMGLNVEMLMSMKDLKLLGWEQLFVNRNIDYRKMETADAEDYYFLINMWDLFISMAPMIVVLFIEGLKRIAVGTVLDLPSIYLILSYIGMIYLPSKAFLVAYVKGLEASKALKILDTIFTIEDLRIQPTKTDLLNPGEIIVKNLYATSLDTSQSYRQLAINHSDERQRLSQEKEAREADNRKTKFASVSVSMDVRLRKGDRLVLLSDSNGGKSSFIRAVSGQLKIEKGMAQYNGKIATVTQKLWFRKKSIRDNVCFGEKADERKLQRVYKLCGLDAHLRGLPKGDLTLIQPNCGWSSAKKLKIALARVLYYEPDIVFLDQPFASIDPQTAQIIYDHICKVFQRTTLVISSQVTGFIHPEDRVLLLNNREAVELGTFGAMLRDFRASYLSRMLYLDQYDHSFLSHAERELERDEQVKKHQQRQIRQRKIKAFLRCMVEIARTKSVQEIDSMIRRHSNVYEQKKATADATGKRQPPVAWEFYEKFFKGAPIWWFVVMYIMMVLAQAFRVFSEWWLGIIKYHPYFLTSYQALAIYIASAIICGLFLGVTGSISPPISGRVTKSVTTTLSQAMASSSFEFFEQQNPLKVAVKINRVNDSLMQDIEQYFLANNYMQSILRNLLHFVATVALLSLRSPVLFLTLSLFILLTNLGILKVYINADRQLFSFRQVNIEAMANTFEEAINGIDLFRTYGRQHLLRQDVTRISYRVSVQAVNYRFAAQGMTILCEISGLVILAVAAFYAISHKFKTGHQGLAVVGTAISFALRMSNIASQTVRDATRTDNLMKLCMKNAYEIIGKNQQKLFDEPTPPENWPVDSSVDMTNVNLQYQSMKKPAVSGVNIKVAPGSRVAICGKGGSGKGTILAGLARVLLPTGQPMGSIKVGGVDTKQIGRKHYSQRVVMLTAYPFIFSGSIQQNLDPFNVHTESQLRKVLQTVELWNELHPDEHYRGNNQAEGKLEYLLTDGGAQLTTNQQQRLNIARVLLMKPTLLICDNFTSSLDMVMKERLLSIVSKELGKVLIGNMQNTIVVIPESVKIATSCDWVVYLSRGIVKEQGNPKDLIARDQGFAKLVKSGTRFHYMFLDRPQKQKSLKQDDTQLEVLSP